MDDSDLRWCRSAAVRLARRYSCPPDDAEQELAMRLLRGLSRRLAWLEVDRWVARDVRGDVKQLTGEDSVCGSVVRVADPDPVDMSDLPLIMRELVELLPPESQHIVLAHISGQTTTAIAKELGTSQSTVHRRLVDALQFLKVEWTRE